VTGRLIALFAALTLLSVLGLSKRALAEPPGSHETAHHTEGAVAADRESQRVRESARDQELLARKDRQARALRAMVAGRLHAADRGDRLFLLAQLQLEIAILRPSADKRTPDWETPATTCRRVLVEEPTFARADEVRFFLAQLEMRRSNPRVALEVLRDLEERHPESHLLCEAWLLGGEAWSAGEDRDRAALQYRRVLERASCARSVTQQARYGLAWALLGGKRADAAAKELRRLAEESGVPTLFRQRVLKDLVLAWSMGEPGRDAPQLLMQAAGEETGGRLVRELAELLLEGRRLEPLLRLTAGFAVAFPRHAALGALRAIRLRALSSLSTPSELKGEIATLRALPGVLTPEVRRAMAGALLDLGQTLIGTPVGQDHTEIASRRQARDVFEGILQSFGDLPQALPACYHLGELLLETEDPRRGLDLLERAATQASSEIRLRAHRRLLMALEQLAARAAPEERAGFQRRFVRGGWRFLEEHPGSSDASGLLLALASQLLVMQEYGEAARAAGVLLHRFPGHPQRAHAVKIALEALDHAGQQEKAYHLAMAELSACGVACDAWRAAAGASAMKRCRELAAASGLDDAQAWAGRAASVAPEGPLGFEARMAGAMLAARRGRLLEAARRYRDLADHRASGAGRVRALAALAEIQAARAQFAAAAGSYDEAARAAPDTSSRLEWLRRSGEAHAAAGDTRAVLAAVDQMERTLEGARVSRRESLRWWLRVARLLSALGGVDGPNGVPYWTRLAPAPTPSRRRLLKLARRLEKEEPQAAARCILLAAALTPTPGPARVLVLRAMDLTSASSRRGAKNDVAAEGRITLARLARALLPRGRSALDPRRELRGLQDLVSSLLEVVEGGNPAWASAAGLALAATYAEMARVVRSAPPPHGLRENERAPYLSALAARAADLRRVGDALITRLARATRDPQGLNHSTLQAARESVPRWMPALDLDHLPEGSAMSQPVLDLLRAERPSAALLAVTGALAVAGPREDLLCARATALFRLGRVPQAVREFRSALALVPTSRCARLNLGVLALWQSSYSEAERLFTGVPGASAITGAAAAAYGLGRADEAVALARRAVAADQRTEATYLLGAILSDHFRRTEEAISLWRACLSAGSRSSALARRRLKDLLSRGSRGATDSEEDVPPARQTSSLEPNS
jgi:tetratricopeptide (TPR) repeat protein